MFNVFIKNNRNNNSKYTLTRLLKMSYINGYKKTHS